MSEQTAVKVGDLVRFTYGLSKVTGTVVEDRGPLGVGGRRLYGVNFTLGPDFSAYTEMPTEEFEVVRNGASVDAAS